MSASAKVRELSLIVAVAIGLPGCSDPAGTTSQEVTAFAVGASNEQTGVAGASLPLPLQVQVQSDGEPKAGVTVVWEVSAGTITPASSLTDNAGVAAAKWTLGEDAGVMVASASIAEAQGSPVTFSATALASTATAVAASNGQSGVVGMTLTQPLQVKVQAGGALGVGVTVSWTMDPQDGSVTPATSITDANGIATATWTLGTLAGARVAYANVTGAQGSPVTFGATALPGPVSGIQKVGSDGQIIPVNLPGFWALTAVATDQYGNGVAGQAVTWTVVSGPVAVLSSAGTTDEEGQSIVVLALNGTQGAAVVRAALAGGRSVDFAITVGPAEGLVIFSWGLGAGPPSFQSWLNLSRPAVDTLQVGETMRWVLQTQDYSPHSIVSVGSPSFQGRTFPVGIPSEVRVTFTTPGTYHYADSTYTSATGIIVVQ